MGRHWQIAILATTVWLTGCTCYKLNTDYPQPLHFKDNVEVVSLHAIYSLEADGKKWKPMEMVCVRKLFLEILRNDLRFDELGLKYPPAEMAPLVADQKAVVDIFRRMDHGQLRNTTIGDAELTSILCPSSAGYVLVVKQVGFTRTAGSVLTGMAQGIAIGIATLGTFYTVPILERSEMEYCVIDKTARKVVVYCAGSMDADPRDENSLREHIKHILRDLQQIKIE